MSKCKTVTLRKRKIKNGTQYSLCLDYYPGYRDIALGDVLKRLPNDYSVVSSSSASWGNTASLGMVAFVSEVSFLLSDVSVLTRSLSVTIL